MAGAAEGQDIYSLRSIVRARQRRPFASIRVSITLMEAHVAVVRKEILP